MKEAVVNVRKKKWIIGTYSQTVDGVWIHDGDYAVLSDDADPSELGVSLMLALSRSVSGIPHPKSWDGHREPLLRAAGVRSWNTYVKGAKSISVRQDDKKIMLTPMANRGARGGFTFLLERTVEVAATAADAEIGAAILQALTYCE